MDNGWARFCAFADDKCLSPVRARHWSISRFVSFRRTARVTSRRTHASHRTHAFVTRTARTQSPINCHVVKLSGCIDLPNKQSYRAVVQYNMMNNNTASPTLGPLGAAAVVAVAGVFAS